MVWGPVSALLLASLVLLLIAAGVEDIRHREIANWKNALIALLAPAWWWASGFGGTDIAWQIGIALAVFAFFIGSFALGQMGGGDVKMIGAVALWLPFSALLFMLVVMAITGGALTLAMLAHRAIRRRGGAPIEVPYGVAIAIATFVAIREPIFNQIA